MLSVTDFEFDPKGTISEVRVHAGAKFGHTGIWSIAKMQSELMPELHRWISKLTARQAADSPPGDLLITMVKETVICIKRVSKNEKVVSLIDLKVIETRNDCENACDCVKRKRGFLCRPM